MKIWYGYGSEHSMNLVMIGQFQAVNDAAQAMRAIEQLTEQVTADIEAKRIEMYEPTDSYTDGALNLLSKIGGTSIGPGELEQFAYDVTCVLENDRVVLTTNEADVSAFLKVLIANGARVEVYSAHHYPGTGYGRGG